MEINGKIIHVLQEKSGQSAKGTWRKQEYVLETGDQYPKKICFMVWGDKIDDFAIKQGDHLTVSIDLESREYNGRWYTDVKAWKVMRGDAQHQDEYGATPVYEEGPLQGNNADYLDDEVPF